MKLSIIAKLMLVPFFILPLNPVKHNASGLHPVNESPKAYEERYLTFKNWMRASSKKRKILVGGYLRLLENDSLPQIAADNQSRAREILANTTPENFVPYINRTYTLSKKALRDSGGGVETIIFQYVRNRLEIEKNHEELLEIAKMVSNAKNTGIVQVAAKQKNEDRPDHAIEHHNISDIPDHYFSFKGWQSRTHEEKIILVIGYMAFLKTLIKEDICINDEEGRRFDLYCKLVTAKQLVDHVDRLYADPLYRDDGAQIIIIRYLLYNFWNYMEDPIMEQG